MNHIGSEPLPEMYAAGLDLDVQCARCGSSVDTERCDQCDDGYDGHDCGADFCDCLYPEDNIPCEYCDGKGVWHTCMSSAEWCDENPLPDRGGIPRGELEWYTVERGDS